MRTLNKIEKDDAIELLKKGISATLIARVMDIPLSTITTWKSQLGNIETYQQEQEKSFKNKNRMIKVAKSVNSTEARIVSTILPFINKDISEDNWMEIQEKIANELKNFAQEN